MNFQCITYDCFSTIIKYISSTTNGINMIDFQQMTGNERKITLHRFRWT